jgi:phosphoribosylanthranilate isomerase
MNPRIKICGINTPDALAAAIQGAADFVGFVFYPPSPRAVTLSQAAALTNVVPADITTVGLFVDPNDAALDEAIGAARLDMIQLHGSETPDRVAAVRARTGKPVMKAIGVATARDIDTAAPYAAVADWLMFDAKPPEGRADALPGGNALAFDWDLLAGRRWDKPWMLAGGLDPESVAEAIRRSGAQAVDVSSGVERARGRKDPALIRRFIAAVRAL